MQSPTICWENTLPIEPSAQPLHPLFEGSKLSDLPAMLVLFFNDMMLGSPSGLQARQRLPPKGCRFPAASGRAGPAMRPREQADGCGR